MLNKRTHVALGHGSVGAAAEVRLAAAGRAEWACRRPAVPTDGRSTLSFGVQIHAPTFHAAFAQWHTLGPQWHTLPSRSGTPLVWRGGRGGLLGARGGLLARGLLISG